MNADYPLTTALLERASHGSQVFVGLCLADAGEGFALVVGTEQIFKRAARVMRYDQPFTENDASCQGLEIGESETGGSFRWGLEIGELVSEESGRACFHVSQVTLFNKETTALDALEKERATMDRNTKPPQKNKAVSVQTEDLHSAQMKLLREYYSRTFPALDELACCRCDERARLIEAALRAYVLDVQQCFKRVSLFKGTPMIELSDMEIIVASAKAYQAKSPIDLVDCELASNWEESGYSRMKPADYAAVINGKLGTSLSVPAMKGRAVTKLRLVSRRKEGRPGNDGLLP